jgi:putative peptidoglycan lipid II flippase
MNNENPKGIAQSAKRFFSGTVLSRLSGMARDVAMAVTFGDHPSVAAFMVAFRFSNILRRLLGEGALQSAFIPHFEGLRVENEFRASYFFRNLSLLLSLLLLSLIVFVEIGLWIGSGNFLWTGYSLDINTQEVIRLSSWMFPSLLFICLYGLNSAFLQCHNSYFTASVAPAAFNFIWIFAVLFLAGSEPSGAMVYLAQAIVIGFLLQWAITLPKTYNKMKKPVETAAKLTEGAIFSQEVMNLAKAASLGALGIGAVQINSFLDAIFARFADLKGPVYLWYAIRLEQLPLALFGIAFINALVPRLARSIKAHKIEEAKQLILYSMKNILIFAIPCTLATVLLGGASVNLIYGRGQFTQEAIWQTTLCLWGYGAALIPSIAVILFSSIFYAQGNFRTPTFLSLIAVLLNVSLNALFVFGFGWGAFSVSLATSASVWFNGGALLFILRKQPESWQFLHSFKKTFQLLLAALFAGVCAFLFDTFFLHKALLDLFSFKIPVFPTQFPSQLLECLGQIGAFFIALIAFGWVTKNQDLREFLNDFLGRSKLVRP